MASNKKKIKEAIKRYRAKQSQKRGVKKPEEKKETEAQSGGVGAKRSDVNYGPKGGQYVQSASGKRHYVGKKPTPTTSRNVREKQKEKLSRRRERAIKKSLEEVVDENITKFVEIFTKAKKDKKGETNEKV